jgi:hypothetical protein
MVVPGVETVIGCSLAIVAMLHSQSLQQLFGRAGGDPGGAFEHPTNLLEDFSGTFQREILTAHAFHSLHFVCHSRDRPSFVESQHQRPSCFGTDITDKTPNHQAASQLPR